MLGTGIRSQIRYEQTLGDNGKDELPFNRKNMEYMEGLRRLKLRFGGSVPG